MSRVLHINDFANAELVPWIRLASAKEPDAAFPAGREYRKDWEVALALRALNAGGALGPDREVLGVGAGNETTIFLLTHFVRRVFATDLYLAPGWGESAAAEMLTNPSANYPRAFRPGRLVVQHMNALDLQYEDGTFDATFSSGSIEHFGSYEAVRVACQELHRVLKPGGTCSLSTEFRIAGAPPGIPSALLFSAADLREYIVGSADWEIFGEYDMTSPDPASLRPTNYASAALEIRRHRRAHGMMAFDRLEWSSYPHVGLRHGDHIWTSCHLALRKPD